MTIRDCYARSWEERQELETKIATLDLYEEVLSENCEHPETYEEHTNRMVETYCGICSKMLYKEYK